MNRGELLEKLKAGESLREANLTEADPLYADFEGVDLTGSDLSRMEIPAGVTGRAWPHGFADTYRAPRWRARFSGATLDRARLDRIVGWKGEFARASLRDTSLVEADLTDADFSGADLRGADLSGANIEGADFANAIWDETTTWPEVGPPR
jgi:uncharacterized protein YjbI with pentapeptide repeats